MNNVCCERKCGAYACEICGACRTEHSEDSVMGCPKHAIHRTTSNCKKIEELEKRILIIQRNRDSVYNQKTRNYQRIKELEAENKAVLRRAESAESDLIVVEQRIEKLITGQKAKIEVGS